MPRIPKDNRISNQTIKLNALTIKINKTFTKTKIEIIASSLKGYERQK